MHRPTVSLLALWAATASAGELEIPHERYALANGLDVVLAPDRSAPIVHVQVWYHVGSKDEAPGLTGFAHLFEHLMFQGSMNSPGEYFTPIQEVGGDLNGTTNSDRTNYFETMPSQYLPLALFMESDRMGALLPVLDQGKLDNQREVVRNERRQRYENPPYGEAYPDLMAALFPEGHPYHHPTIGSHVDLENASLDDVSAFFKTWYAPNNATLVVVGDFETATAKALIEENFGWIPAAPEPTRRETPSATLATDVVIVQHDDVPDDKLWMAWHSPALFAPGDADLDLFASILCGGKDSRLYQQLVKKSKIARDLSCGQGSRHLQSAFVLSATAADGHSTEEIAEAVVGAFKQLVSGEAPPLPHEVEAARAAFEVGFYESLETIDGKGGVLSSYLFHTNDPGYLQRDLDRYLAVTAESITSAAKATFTQHRVQLHIKPKTEEAK